MSKQFDIPDGYEELMSEPKLISELTKAERKKIGRKVLNATLKNAPEGTKIYGSGDLILPDGSLVARTGHGRGKNAQYDYTPPEGYEVIPEPAKADEEAYRQSVEDVRKVRKEEAKGRYDAYHGRMAEEGNNTDPIEADTAIQEPAQGTLTDEPMSEYEFSLPRAWEVIKGVNPGIKSIVDAVDAGEKIIDQGQEYGVGSVLSDAGNGLMGELAAPFDSESSQWWKDRQEIPDSESARAGEAIADEAMLDAAGGALGKIGGKIYQGMKYGGEAFGKRATVAAANAEKQAKLFGQSPLEAAVARQRAYENMTQVQPRHSYAKAFVGDAQPVAGSVRIDPIPYTPPLNEKDLLTKVMRERNHLEGKDLDGKGMSGADLMDPTGRGNLEYPTFNRLADTAAHNMKRVYSDAAMLKRNDAELDQIFSQGKALDKALSMRQQRWDKLPNAGQDIGAAVGMIMGSRGGSGKQSGSSKPEFEGGMPDYESVKNMSDEEFGRYNRQYLGGAGLP